MLRPLKCLFMFAIPALATASAGAAEWSDTSIGVRHGTTFREPYEAARDLRLGVEYEFWKNKFGNNWRGPAGSGAFAHTPMVRAEYHF